MIDDCYINNLAENQVSDGFHQFAGSSQKGLHGTPGAIS